MKTNTLSPELLKTINAYWRADNYLSAGQIYLYDTLLKRSLALADVKHMLCEGWLEGYLFTGRHGLFDCYEAFIHGGIGARQCG